jgi:hypothetical protein
MHSESRTAPWRVLNFTLAALPRRLAGPVVVNGFVQQMTVDHRPSAASVVTVGVHYP